jgi:hypothetical protein
MQLPVELIDRPRNQPAERSAEENLAGWNHFVQLLEHLSSPGHFGFVNRPVAAQLDFGFNGNFRCGE